MRYKLFSLSLFQTGSDVMSIYPPGGVRSNITTDSERLSATFYLCLIDTFALSRTVYEILAVLTDFCVNRK